MGWHCLGRISSGGVSKATPSRWQLLHASCTRVHVPVASCRSLEPKLLGLACYACCGDTREPAAVCTLPVHHEVCYAACCVTCPCCMLCRVLCCAVCHSRTVKELKESISGAQLDAGDLEQQAQHLRRQLATLSDRIKRLESQVRWAVQKHLGLSVHHMPRHLESRCPQHRSCEFPTPCLLHPVVLCCALLCCVQAAVKKEALESGIEEALRDKEAAMAENAAHQAKCLQHEAEVGAACMSIHGPV